MRRKRSMVPSARCTAVSVDSRAVLSIRQRMTTARSRPSNVGRPLCGMQHCAVRPASSMQHSDLASMASRLLLHRAGPVSSGLVKRMSCHAMRLLVLSAARMALLYHKCHATRPLDQMYVVMQVLAFVLPACGMQLDLHRCIMALDLSPGTGAHQSSAECSAIHL